MSSLKANVVRELTKPGRYGDGQGLYLNIAPGGTKSWVMRATRNGKRGAWGLGSYKAVSLQAARAKAELYRGLLAEGRDPWAKAEQGRMERAQDLDRIPTFKEAALKVHAAKLPGFSSAKHGDNWIQMLKRHVFPLFGDTPVDEISPAGRERLPGTLRPSANRDGPPPQIPNERDIRRLH